VPPPPPEPPPAPEALGDEPPPFLPINQKKSRIYLEVSRLFNNFAGDFKQKSTK